MHDSTHTAPTSSSVSRSSSTNAVSSVAPAGPSATRFRPRAVRDIERAAWNSSDAATSLTAARACNKEWLTSGWKNTRRSRSGGGVRRSSASASARETYSTSPTSFRCVRAHGALFVENRYQLCG